MGPKYGIFELLMRSLKRSRDMNGSRYQYTDFMMPIKPFAQVDFILTIKYYLRKFEQCLLELKFGVVTLTEAVFNEPNI